MSYVTVPSLYFEESFIQIRLELCLQRNKVTIEFILKILRLPCKCIGRGITTCSHDGGPQRIEHVLINHYFCSKKVA